MQFLMAIAFAGLMANTQPAAVESLVNTTCVGECGNRAEMVYMAPELGGMVDLMLKVDQYDLCESHASAAMVFVNDKFVGRVILEENAVFPLSVEAGSEVRVVSGIRTVHPTIRCIELGEVRVGLYETF